MHWLKHLNASVQTHGNVVLVLSCRGARRVFEFPDAASYNMCSDRMFFPEYTVPEYAAASLGLSV